MAKILVVEDDPTIAELVEFTLCRVGHEPTLIGTAEEGFAATRCEAFDAALIDWMLPGRSGLWLVERLRADADRAALPVLMMSAMLEGGERILDVEFGVDDFVAKPFSPRELVARIEGLIRCVESAAAAAVLDHGPMHLDASTRTVTLSGRRVPLRLIEFEFLRLLMADRIGEMSSGALRDHVWGALSNVSDATVEVHMNRLRNALRTDGSALIELIRFGRYRLIPHAELVD